ncbi:MAG: putative toxin-antitoxin system toxin component, PIN family [Rhodoferax sp.]|nr:putative toxin-antitoxin system toxin component, PIN family [Rhodoferax sp.]
MPAILPPPPGVCVVIDTNIVLDLFVFEDPATLALSQALAAALTQGQPRWLATDAMREELARVLAYPQVLKRMAFYARSAAEVLGHFDRLCHLVDVAPKASVTCKDPDDQKFIDLAVAHSAALLSKDHAVLCMDKRMRGLGVPFVGRVWLA